VTPAALRALPQNGGQNRRKNRRTDRSITAAQRPQIESSGKSISRINALPQRAIRL
jgi:hypothetical protein